MHTKVTEVTEPSEIRNSGDQNSESKNNICGQSEKRLLWCARGPDYIVFLCTKLVTGRTGFLYFGLVFYKDGDFLFCTFFLGFFLNRKKKTLKPKTINISKIVFVIQFQ